MSKEHQIVELLCKLHGSSIEHVFMRAVRHFYHLHEDELLAIRQATKASLINDYIYQYFQEEFENVGSFSFIEKSRGRFIAYDNKLLIRIKKLGNAKRPFINKTRAANEFNTQGNMDFIKDVKVSNVYLGYVLNYTSGNIDEIAFAYPNKLGTIAWTINIEEQLIQQTLDYIVPVDQGKDDSKACKHKRLIPKSTNGKEIQK
jgi:hypothetical protein